jgi:hypothetical protein
MAKKQKQPKKSKKQKLKNEADTEPAWAQTERVVELLERSLDELARVVRDVKLPNLATGHPEQFDVVIESGQAPRISRTIVEVQDRTRPVEVNTFRGWCEKMRQVGANRLLCVSAHPFPQSIKDSVAKEHGPRVLLVRLEALEAQQWPFQIFNNAMRVYNPTIRLDTSDKRNPLFSFPADQNPFTEFLQSSIHSQGSDRRIQREGQAELSALGEIIDEGIRRLNQDPNMLRLPEGDHKVTVEWHPRDLRFCFNGQSAPIQTITVTYCVGIEAMNFPFEISSYAQEGQTLAWVARASGKIDGEDAEIRFTLIPDANGCFRFSHAQLCGFKAGGFVFLGQIPETPAPLG